MDKLTGFISRPSNLLPADWMTILYLAVTGVLACIFHKRLPSWRLYVITHIFVVGAIWALASAPLNALSSWLRFTRYWYPIATIPIFYWGVSPLAQMIVQGYLDEQVLVWENRLFKGQPSIYLSKRFPSTILSGVLHLCYFSYYAIVVSLAAVLYSQGKQEKFQEVVFAEVLTFNLCLLLYIFMPVAGPRYNNGKLRGRLAEGVFFKLTHAILSRWSSKGTAFPSSHCAIAVLVALYAARFDAMTCAILGPLSLGLVIGTVYGRFHYAVDAIAGTALAFVMFGIAPHLYRLLS